MSACASTRSGATSATPRIAAKVWHRAMYHDPGVPVFGSRIQQVEHIGFTLMLAERADVHAARLVAHRCRGRRRRGARHHPTVGHAGRVTPARAAHRHRARLGVAAARRSPRCRGRHTATSTDCACVVDDDGEVAFDDFSSADASGEQYWRNRDDAALLVLTAQLVGDDRAIAAMVDTLGKERAGAGDPGGAARGAAARPHQGSEAPEQGPQVSARRAGRPPPASRTSRRSRSSG